MLSDSSVVAVSVTGSADDAELLKAACARIVFAVFVVCVFRRFAFVVCGFVVRVVRGFVVCAVVCGFVSRDETLDAAVSSALDAAVITGRVVFAEVRFADVVVAVVAALVVLVVVLAVVSFAVVCVAGNGE